VIATMLASGAAAIPSLSEYFTLIQPHVIDGMYTPKRIQEPFTADLNGDGNTDMVVLGWVVLPFDQVVAQPGQVFFGDGAGNFTRAPSTQFPDTLKTFTCGVLFGELNGDRRLDLFLPCSADASYSQVPGEQNRLYLSQADGTWKDATETLPQIINYAVNGAIGDLSGRGLNDIIVNTGYGGANQILPYGLLNNGSGQFTITRSILPVARGQAMDTSTGYWSYATTLGDLNGDGLPELILGTFGNPQYNRLKGSVIVWNHAGSFADNDQTVLPAPMPFPTHAVELVKSVDINGDDLPDLVIAGPQLDPFYDGWFVQLLLNKGDRTFVDVTQTALQPGDIYGGTPGVATGSPYPTLLQILDFNSDGFPDFSLEYFGSLRPNTPLIFLNDGTGHVSTLKVQDFVAPGDESVLRDTHLIPTRNGYSFIKVYQQPGLPERGIFLTGLLAKKPYHLGANPVGTPSFNISNSGGVSLTSSGTATTTAVGYARIQADSGSAAPSGVGIFSYRNNNVLVSEVGVPAVPAVTSGRIYAEMGGPINAGVAIANPNTSPAVVTFQLTDSAGNSAGGGSTTIAAGQQIARFLDQPPFNVYRTQSFQGTFSFTSSLPVAVVALRGLTNERGDFLMSALPVIDTTSVPANGTIVVPHFADGGGWTTQVLLVNPTDTGMMGTFQFLNPSGLPANITIAGQNASSFNYYVAPRSSQKHSTSGLGTLTLSGSIRIIPTGGGPSPVPLIVFSYRPAGFTVSEAAVPVTTSNALRLYVESSGVAGATGSVDSGIAVANTSATPALVNFDITDLAGTPVPGMSRVTLTIPALGQTAKFLSDVFPSLPKPFKGVLRITTTSNRLSVVGLRTRINERLEFLMTTTTPADENSPATSTELFFPQTVDGGGYTTQFILFSGTAGQTTSGSLRLFKPDGSAFRITLN